MTTLAVKILNPTARRVLYDLASDGLIEVVPFTSAITDHLQETSDTNHQAAINDAMHEADRRYDETFQRLAQ